MITYKVLLKRDAIHASMRERQSWVRERQSKIEQLSTAQAQDDELLISEIHTSMRERQSKIEQLSIICVSNSGR